LAHKLTVRTALFASTVRSVEALIKYEAVIREREKTAALDRAIHVCEFTGFLDEEGKTVGCLLHPLAPGNRGVDLRGLCYYGSVACKSFFCPAWDSLDPAHREILAACIDDWHTYGLEANDVIFVKAVFGLLEANLGGPLDARALFRTPAAEIFKEIMGWKNEWPYRCSTRVRRSRYYFRDASATTLNNTIACTAAILESLRFTFEIQGEMHGAEDLIGRQAARFVASYNRLT
jgi:hypothetical protein